MQCAHTLGRDTHSWASASNNCLYFTPFRVFAHPSNPILYSSHAQAAATDVNKPLCWQSGARELDFTLFYPYTIRMPSLHLLHNFLSFFIAALQIVECGMRSHSNTAITILPLLAATGLLTRSLRLLRSQQYQCWSLKYNNRFTIFSHNFWFIWKLKLKINGEWECGSFICIEALNASNIVIANRNILFEQSLIFCSINNR